LDAQLRGLRTVLFEAGDFAGATSSVSTKLVHGGIRYLQEAFTDLDPQQYRVVKRSLHERRAMLDNAPFLAHSIEFLIPCHSLWDRHYYTVGVKLYDWIAGRQNLSPSRYYPRTDVLRRMALLSPARLRGTVTYSDGQFDDARYGMVLINNFEECGGEALNYGRVVELEKTNKGKICGVAVEDQLTRQRFAVNARVVVNATGPFADQLRLMANSKLPGRLRLSKGVHIVLPLTAENMTNAILVPKTDDNRVIFAIPWLGRLLVGTTDTEIAPGEEVFVTREEVDFLLQQLNRYILPPFHREQIVSAFGGVRPLVSSGVRATRKLIRDYEVEMDSESGLISVLGGKWTTYRAMAEDAINVVQRQLGVPVTSALTRQHPLTGSEGYTANYWTTLVRRFSIRPETARHLAEKYGTRADQLCALAQRDSDLQLPLVEGFPAIRAEVAYSVEVEAALTLEDVLARRIGLQLFDWKLAMKAASTAAQIMRPLLGWDEAHTRIAIEEYVARIATAMRRIDLKPYASAS
jgi:glycerol-3-phosphate dehydrogenase